jgi:hypothetical protein
VSEGPGGARDRPEDAEDDWAGWSHPAEADDEPSGDDEEAPPGRAAWKAPPAERPPTLRERLRRRYGFTDRQWYVVETLLLVAPYPVFVLVYLTVPVDETLFLVVTLLYSIAAMYVGFLS